MNTWQEDFKNAIKNHHDLEIFLDKKIPQTNFKSFLPIPFLEKIKHAGPNSPLWKQFIPSDYENNSNGLKDPIGDQKYLVTKNLIHRYENRALLIPTTICPVSCRYCFRKNELETSDLIFKADLQNSLEYLKAHPEINEVILTGGDPLILSNEKLHELILELKAISSIKFLRIHTRTPIILPNRIDSGLIEVLNLARHYFTQVALMIHTNHVDEIDADVESAFKRLKQTDTLIFSQSVLLKEINLDVDTLITLFTKLSTLGIIPYYLHHPDHAYGTDHFQVDLESGRHIYAQLRKKLSGWMIPEYIIDIPEGHGKVSAFNPEGIKFNGELLDINGKMIRIL
jgi:lysine 2,3-aminomutase